MRSTPVASDVKITMSVSGRQGARVQAMPGVGGGARSFLAPVYTGRDDDNGRIDLDRTAVPVGMGRGEEEGSRWPPTWSAAGNCGAAGRGVQPGRSPLDGGGSLHNALHRSPGSGGSRGDIAGTESPALAEASGCAVADTHRCRRCSPTRTLGACPTSERLFRLIETRSAQRLCAERW